MLIAINATHTRILIKSKYLKKYKKYNKISSSLIDRKGRSKYQGYKIKPGTVLIDQSVTGLYERRLEL